MEEWKKKKGKSEPQHSPFILRILMIMITLIVWPGERSCPCYLFINIAIAYG
jgi:hypothetical protein